MIKVFPIIVILGLTADLIAQFIWKMVYFPEPLLVVILEVMGIIILAGIGIKYCLKE